MIICCHLNPSRPDLLPCCRSCFLSSQTYIIYGCAPLWLLLTFASNGLNLFLLLLFNFCLLILLRFASMPQGGTCFSLKPVAENHLCRLYATCVECVWRFTVTLQFHPLVLSLNAETGTELTPHMVKHSHGLQASQYCFPMQPLSRSRQPFAA